MKTIERLLNENYGFFTEADLPNIIFENRLQPCLVRCGSGRFTCPAQDVANFVKMVESSEDYVRDISILTPELNNQTTLY